MSFGEALQFYFSDATFYLADFFVAIGFTLLLLKLPFEKKKLWKAGINFVVLYAICLAFFSLMFAVTNVIGNRNLSVTQGLFALAMPIAVLVFGLIFAKGSRKLHRYIKIIILVSSIAVVEVLSKNFGFFVGLVFENVSAIVTIARALAYIIFPVVCILMKVIDINRYRNLSSEMVIIISLLSILLVVVSVYEQASMSQEKTITLLLSVLDIVLLFILNFSYYTTYKNIENRHHITNLEVQKTLEDAERMSIAIDQSNREELEKLRHDIKNQFSYVDILLQQGNNEEARKYIGDYLNTSNPVLNSFSCSNKVINSIINLELTKAKIKKIKIDVKVVVPPVLPFEDIDLVSLLTNMIDNAIENYCSEEKSPIVVRIMKQNDFIRFIVSNPVNLEKINLRSLTKTSKIGRGHGYGTKIIKNIASAYNGYVDFSIEESNFVCDAVLNLNTKETSNDKDCDS